jgi:hypothetical protein
MWTDSADQINDGKSQVVVGLIPVDPLPKRWAYN